MTLSHRIYYLRNTFMVLFVQFQVVLSAAWSILCKNLGSSKMDDKEGYTTEVAPPWGYHVVCKKNK